MTWRAWGATWKPQTELHTKAITLVWGTLGLRISVLGLGMFGSKMVGWNWGAHPSRSHIFYIANTKAQQWKSWIMQKIINLAFKLNRI